MNTDAKVFEVNFTNLADANDFIKLQRRVIEAQDEMYGVVMSYSKVLDALLQYPGSRGKIERVGEKIRAAEEAMGAIYDKKNWTL